MKLIKFGCASVSALSLTIALLLLPTMALAQQQEVSLKVTLPEADVVWRALRKLPVEEVELIMNKIRQQVAEQTAPKSVDNKEPEK